MITNDFSYIIIETCRNFSGFEKFIIDIYETYKSIEKTKEKIYNYGNPEKINKLKVRYSQIDIETEDIVEKILKIYYTDLFIELFDEKYIKGSIRFFRLRYGDDMLKFINVNKIMTELKKGV